MLAAASAFERRDQSHDRLSMTGWLGPTSDLIGTLSAVTLPRRRYQPEGTGRPGTSARLSALERPRTPHLQRPPNFNTFKL